MVFLGCRNSNYRPGQVNLGGHRVDFGRPTGMWSNSSIPSTVGPHGRSWDRFYRGMSQGVSYIGNAVSGGGLGRIARRSWDLINYGRNSLFSYKKPGRVNPGGHRVDFGQPTGMWSASSIPSTVGPHGRSWDRFYRGMSQGVSYIGNAVSGGGLGRIARQSWQAMGNLGGIAGIKEYNQVNRTALNPNGGSNFDLQNHFRSVNPFSVSNFHRHGAFRGLST